MVPFLVPFPLWGLAAAALYYYGEKFFKYQAPIARIVVPLLVGIFSLLTVYFVRLSLKQRKGTWRRKFSSILLLTLMVAVVLFFDGLFLYLLAPHLAAIRFRTGPVLTLGTGQDPATGISIVWRTGGKTTTSVLLGSNPSQMNEYASIEAPSQWHKISIDGLSPDTEYRYRIDGLRSNESFSFRTAKEASSSFTFLLFSDARQNDGEFLVRLLPNVPLFMEEDSENRGVEPAFSIVTGDITGEGFNVATWKTFFDDISITSRLAVTRPMIFAPGNHERHDDPGGTMFERILPLVNRPGFYYSFDYGQVHFTIIDPWNEEMGNWGDFDAAQRKWVEQDLASAIDADYRVVCLHPPPIHNDGTPYESLESLVELCETYDVDIVFFGHHHSHWVKEMNEVWYVLLGVGGNMTYFRDGAGYAQVDVSSQEMTVSMHWVDGTEELLCTIPR